MSQITNEVKNQIKKRRTFAIISHPDALRMMSFVRLWRPPDILPELQISTRMELLTTVQCLKICLIRQSQVEKSSVARPAIPVSLSHREARS